VKEFSGILDGLREKGLLRKLVQIDSSSGARIAIRGQQYINYSSNDYLGLSGHPLIVQSAVTAAREYGVGSGSSRLLSGTYPSHSKLEKRIAKFKKTGSALLFNTGFSANTGIIPAIAGDETIIFSDALNHASIVDGIRLSRAKKIIYRHKDTEHLGTLLKKYSHSKTKVSERKLIITDTVFSMDGDIAPLKEIISLSMRYNTMLMIDDAHGTGVLGKNGRGGLEHFGIRSGTIVQMGTLSKAIGCFGGFAAGPKNIIDLLINSARSFMYSTSLPSSVAEAGIRAIDIVSSRSVKLRKKLWKNRNRLYHGLVNIGFNTLGSETPIIPVLVGSEHSALKMGRYLFRKKIFAPAIRPPTVPEGKCRIRFSVTASHTDEDIERLLDIMEKYKKKGSGIQGVKDSRV
jgi:glycine C-acetyltransferase